MKAFAHCDEGFCPKRNPEGSGQVSFSDAQYAGRDEDQCISRHKEHHIHDHDYAKRKHADNQTEDTQRQHRDIGNTTLLAAPDEDLGRQIVFGQREEAPRAGRDIGIEDRELGEDRYDYEDYAKRRCDLCHHITVGQAPLCRPFTPVSEGSQSGHSGQYVDRHDQGNGYQCGSRDHLRILEFTGYRRHGLIAGVHPHPYGKPVSDALQQSLVWRNEGNKGICLPCCEANSGDQGEGRQHQDGEDGAYRSHIPDTPDIDVGEDDDDGGLEQILL